MKERERDEERGTGRAHFVNKQLTSQWNASVISFSVKITVQVDVFPITPQSLPLRNAGR